MRKYFILTGKLLKSGLGDMTASGNSKKKKRRLSGAAVWLILLVCLLPMIGLLYQAGAGAYGLWPPWDRRASLWISRFLPAPS